MTSSTFHISPNFVNNSVARGRLPLAGARSRRRLSFLLPPVSPPTLVCISPPIVNTILTTITPSVLVLKSSDATSGLVRPCPGLLALLPPPSSLPSAFLPRLPHFVATGRSPDDKQPQRLISGFFPAVVRPSGSTAPSPARDIWRLRTCCPACCQQPARRGGASCLSFFFLLFVGVRPFFKKNKKSGLVRPAFPLNTSSLSFCLSSHFPFLPLLSLCRSPLISREVSGQVGCLPCGWLRY